MDIEIRELLHVLNLPDHFVSLKEAIFFETGSAEITSNALHLEMGVFCEA